MFKYYEWLLLIVPVLGALLNGLFGKQSSNRAQNRIAVGAVAGVLVVSLPLLIGESLEPGLIGRPHRLPWIEIWSGSRFITAPFVLRIDALSILMLLTITVVELFIHLEAIHQLADTPSRHIILSLLNGTFAALLVTVLADNLFVLLLGWSLVGWSARALRSAFSTSPDALTPDTAEPIVPQLIGDLGLTLAVILLGSLYASVAFHDIFAQQLPAGVDETSPTIEAIATLLIVISAAVRAAQAPFSAWLPRSAKIQDLCSAHPLIAVAPAIYMLARLYPLSERIPWIATLLLAWGATTAVGMGLLAFLRPDRSQAIDRLALGQGGMLFIALGAGQYATAIAFLLAYVVSHLLLKMLTLHPLTPRRSAARRGPWKLLIVALAAAVGVPPAPIFAATARLLATLFDEHLVFFWPTSIAVLLFAAAAARSLSQRPARRPSAQSSGVMALLLILAVLGIVSLTAPPLIERFVRPILDNANDAVAWWWFALNLGIVGGGIGIGYALRTRSNRAISRQPQPLETRIQKELGRLSHVLNTAGNALVEVIEPLAAGSTFGMLAALFKPRPSSKSPPSSPPTLSLITFFLGMASLIAFLLLQGGQGQ